MKPRALRSPGAVAVPISFAGQEPLGIDAGEFDEAEQDRAGDGFPTFELDPRTGGDPNLLGQERPAVFAIFIEANLAQAIGQKLSPFHRAILSMFRTCTAWSTSLSPVRQPAIAFRGYVICEWRRPDVENMVSIGSIDKHEPRKTGCAHWLVFGRSESIGSTQRPIALRCRDNAVEDHCSTTVTVLFVE
jgi:hypothetical protein